MMKNKILFPIVKMEGKKEQKHETNKQDKDIYCVKCKKWTANEGETVFVTLKNSKKAMVKKCKTCGIRKYVFVS